MAGASAKKKPIGRGSLTVGRGKGMPRQETLAGKIKRKHRPNRRRNGPEIAILRVICEPVTGLVSGGQDECMGS